MEVQYFILKGGKLDMLQRWLKSLKSLKTKHFYDGSAPENEYDYIGRVFGIYGETVPRPLCILKSVDNPNTWISYLLSYECIIWIYGSFIGPLESWEGYAWPLERYSNSTGGQLWLCSEGKKADPTFLQPAWANVATALSCM